VKTVIEMAREAGWDDHHAGFDTRIERLVALVRADERDRAMRENAYVQAEREACWRLCDALWIEGKDAHDCREAIRARGNT
jgi:hypothetical protein